MRFYLETNALYNLVKLEKNVIENSFTSALSILELIAGIDSSNYLKRRAVAMNVKRFSIAIEWIFPQQLILNSFNVFDDYQLVDNRTTSLSALFKDLIRSETYQAFCDTPSFNHAELGWQFFSNLDHVLDKDFIEATMMGNNLFKNSLTTASEIEFENITHTIETGKDLESFFRKHPLFNDSITILALAKAMKNAGPVISEEDIYNSYNDHIAIFVHCFSWFCSDKVCNLNLAGRNDFQDLSHLLYLGNNFSWKIVSRDNIFQKCAPGMVAGWED